MKNREHKAPDTSVKIKDFDELVGIVRKLKKQGKKVALSHGVFDLLHPGHIRHFESARNMCDVLVCTITKDEFVNKGPGRPVFNQRLRTESVAALECVDYVAVNKWPIAVETIKRLKPDIYVKGADYRRRKDDVTGKIFDEEKAVQSVGGRIAFTDEITFSSSQILNRHFSVYPKETAEFIHFFKDRYSPESIIKILKSLGKLKVLVIGDIIIDEYHYCAGIGKPQKADILAAQYLSEEKFTGGVLAVAKHIANFCREVNLVSVIGTKNNYESFILENLSPNIKPKFFYRHDVPTVVKQRFLNPAFLSKIFEINFIDDTKTTPEVSKEVCAYLNKVMRKYDLVVVADFGHGFLTADIINVLSSKSKFMAVNTQTNSANMGYNLITKYPRASFVCIDEPEIRLAMHDKFGDLQKLILGVTRRLKCNKIIVTRGHLGSVSYEKGKGFSSIPVLSKEIVDRIGAGDAFLAVASPLIAAGHPIELAAFVGNAVGALAVLIVGNRNPVEQVPLFKFITTLLK
ncbi:MAG: adenylyltransferase/cytidyltransferase family protein [Candidatus Omnitrophica bacterium]|nr:adenylyltransferase/cytidyltransferase family protein [Candidatus Omnitrophota bacterium]